MLGDAHPRLQLSKLLAFMLPASSQSSDKLEEQMKLADEVSAYVSKEDKTDAKAKDDDKVDRNGPFKCMSSVLKKRHRERKQLWKFHTI